MKKARIILSAVAVFAVVGGAFAFKARQANVFFTSDPANGRFSSQILTTLTTNLQGPGATTTKFLTTVSTTATTIPLATLREVQ